MSYFVPSPMSDMIHSLGCCGCGNPEETYEAIHEMLLYYSDINTHSNYPRIYKGLVTDEVNPYIQFMAYVLDGKGFLEHGSSIIGAWLTDKGKQLLSYMTEFAKYEYEMDDVPQDLMYVEKYHSC